MAFKKYAKKVVRKVGRMAKRRYFKGKGYSRPKLAQMFRDIQTVKSVLNTEKRRVENYIGGQAIGQVNGNVNGFYSWDATPVVTEGVGYNQRIGSSLKLCSSHFSFQFIQMSSCVAPIKGEVWMVLHKGAPTVTPGTYPVQIFNPNAFITGASIIDLNSNLDPDYFGRYKIIRRKKFSISPDSFSTQPIVKTIKMGIKYFGKKGHHIRFNDDGTTVTDGQLIMFVVLDGGNSSTTTISTLGNITQAGTSTGLFMNSSWTHYYYDN